MTREIKFRAWDKSQNKMFYDGDRYSPDGTPTTGAIFVTNKGIVYTVTHKVSDYVEVNKNGKKDTYYSNWDYEAFYSKTLELMQYTGLHDKNGKEIYEGDIIGGLKGYKGKDLTLVVEFEYGAYYVGGDELYSHNEVCEVIGNIYENPELLEERSKIEKM